MRCACPECGTYMIQSEGVELGCVCPDCLTRCRACLGTNTVVPRDQLKNHFTDLAAPFTGFVKKGKDLDDDPDRFRPD